MLIAFLFKVDQLPRLKHRNILDLYGYSNDSTDNPCLVYPFMKNGTLKDVLMYDSQHPMHLTSIQRLEISKGIAEGIYHIHSNPTDERTFLTHRDIKPANILLDDKMTPKVFNAIDFNNKYFWREFLCIEADVYIEKLINSDS